MGILSDPTSSSAQRSKFSKFFIKGNRLICIIFYIAGIIWFCALGHTDFNNATYFSENALLPGLVYSEIKTEHSNYALNLYEELVRERESHKSTTPYAWLQAKMRQIGLDTYTHNFTLNYPFGGGKVFTGKNVYGILRAPSIGSTESFVITAPYRPPDSIQSDILPSIPLLLAFAQFARKQKYWAKDIIFLITEQEQLGMQAWLDAYQGSDENDVLKSGTLDARAGSIQAAINLEIQGFDVNYIDVKIEGLNGQLPNLDLVNLVNRIALKEGLSSGHRQTSSKRRSGAKSKIQTNLKHVLGMILTQATGVPNGNHGLFHRYGIEALTINAHKRDTVANSQRNLHGAASIIKLIEGISRSLNNLLQRFHRSFFFYLLVATDRYISIGDYTPALGLMAGSLLIKAFIIWLKISEKRKKLEDENENDDGSNELPSVQYLDVGKFLIGSHVFGFVVLYLPFYGKLEELFHQNGIPTEQFLSTVFGILSIVSLLAPLLLKFNSDNIQILHIAALLEIGTALIIVGMFNFSLGLILSVFIVPFAILVNPESRPTISVSKILCFFFHPILVASTIVLAYTAYTFSELNYDMIIRRAISATMDAITFSIVDSIIYGNWIFDLVAVVFCPVWIMFWTVVCFKPAREQIKIKTN